MPVLEFPARTDQTVTMVETVSWEALGAKTVLVSVALAADPREEPVELPLVVVPAGAAACRGMPGLSAPQDCLAQAERPAGLELPRVKTTGIHPRPIGVQMERTEVRARTGRPLAILLYLRTAMHHRLPRRVPREFRAMAVGAVVVVVAVMTIAIRTAGPVAEAARAAAVAFREPAASQAARLFRFTFGPQISNWRIALSSPALVEMVEPVAPAAPAELAV